MVRGARAPGAGRGRSLHLNTSRLGYKTLTASATPLAAHRLPQHARSLERIARELGNEAALDDQHTITLHRSGGGSTVSLLVHMPFVVQNRSSAGHLPVAS